MKGKCLLGEPTRFASGGTGGHYAWKIGKGYAVVAGAFFVD
jgi:hypothetical protein